MEMEAEIRYIVTGNGTKRFGELFISARLNQSF